MIGTVKSGAGIRGSTDTLSHVRAFAASRLLVLLPLLAAGCAGVSPAPTDPDGVWPGIDRLSSWSACCATDRNGWRLNGPYVEEGPASAEFELRVRRDPGEAVRLARSLLREDPANERLTVLLWALEGVTSEEVIDLCWEVLVRVSWDERCDAGSYASKILQVRIGHHAEAEQREAALARLLARARSPEDRANLGFLAWRQGCLGELPPRISAEFADAVLHAPDKFPLPRAFSPRRDGPPGNLKAWRILLL
ncbi:MAG: hypothetical protein IT452_13210, partial [Planctomycetia bacterium]|nr:hypothetical protein [Planctomycetia bacterium]